MNPLSLSPMISRFLRASRALWAVVFAVATAASLAGAAAPKPANDVAVTMSPFEVRAASVDFKRWIKVSSPNYIIYTDAKEKEALDAIREFEMLHRAAQVFFRRRIQSLPPTHLVMPTSNSDWKKIRSKGSVEWTASVSMPSGYLTRLILVEYDWQRETLDSVRSMQGQGLVDAMNLDGPLWFSAGVGSFFETAEFKEGSLVLGRQNPRTLALQMEGYLPWQRFFEIKHTSDEFRKEWEVGKVFAQSAGFVQYLLTNPEPVWADRLIEWAALMEADNPPSEPEFKRIFGQDFKGWQKTMEAYHRTGKYNMTSVRVPAASMQFTPVRIDLPVTEMRELFVLSQILNQDIPDSRASLTALLLRDIKTESLRELLAAACYKRELKDQAYTELKKLEAAGSLNPSVHAAIARHICYDHIKKITIHARLSAEVAAQVHASATRALELEPRHQMGSDFYVWSLALGPKVDASTIEKLEKHYRVVVDETPTSDVMSALAVAHWRLGQTDRARLVAETLRDSPFADKEAREIARDLLEVLRQPFAAP